MKSILLYYVYPLLLSQQWPPPSFTWENKEQISVFTKTSMLKNPFLPDIQSASDHEFFNLDSFSRFICNIGFVLAVLGLHCCSDFSLLAECRGGSSLVEVHRLLIAVASVIVKHGLQGTGASVVAVSGLSSCGSQALEQSLSSCGTGT